MKIFIIPLLLLAILYLFFTSASVFAQGIGQSQQQQNTFRITRPGQGFGIDLGGPNYSVRLDVLLRNVITLLFTGGAIGFTIMIIWGAVEWILSGGDKEKIAGARKRITTAITGLAILSLSFLIVVTAGQILSINALQFGDFKVPGLGS